LRLRADAAGGNTVLVQASINCFVFLVASRLTAAVACALAEPATLFAALKNMLINGFFISTPHRGQEVKFYRVCLSRPFDTDRQPSVRAATVLVPTLEIVAGTLNHRTFAEKNDRVRTAPIPVRKFGSRYQSYIEITSNSPQRA
jgi:hypothetical protein